MNSSPIRRKVLIVEDEPAIRNIIYTLLTGLGCEGEIAESGPQALALIDRDKYDAVLLDLRCTNLRPEEVVPRIHEIRPNLVGRVLVITGEFADAKTMGLIEQHFLLEVPDHGLLQNLWGSLRALLGIAPTTNHAT